MGTRSNVLLVILILLWFCGEDGTEEPLKYEYQLLVQP